MPGTSSRILVSGFDQVANAVGAVADNLRGHPRAGGHHVSIHYENAIVAALQQLLNDHPARELGGIQEGVPDLVNGSQVDGNALTLIAVERLHYYGRTNLFEDAHGGFF